MAVKDLKDRRDFGLYIVGDEDVGKTTLLRRIIGTSKDYEDRRDHDMGSGLTIATGHAVAQEAVVLLTFVTHSAQYLDRWLDKFGDRKDFANGIVYVFSLSDEKSFRNIPKWVSKASKAFGKLPGLLVGNKADLEKERAVPRDSAEKLAKKLGLHYFETSMFGGPLLGTEFESFLEELIKRRWPDWSAGSPIPLDQLKPELQAAVEKRRKEVIAVLEKCIAQEEEAVRKLRSARDQIQHAGMKLFLEERACRSELNAEWLRLDVEGMRTNAFTSMLSKFWRIPPFRYEADALRQIEALYQDAVVATDDKHLELELSRLLGAVRSRLSDLEFDATSTEASMTTLSVGLRAKK